MAKVFDSIDEALASWITAQPVWFVATAPLAAGGHINVSPRGHGTLSILGPHRVGWADYTGSGVETIAHLRENGRICLMFASVDRRPRIVRLHGRGTVALPGDPAYDEVATATDGDGAGWLDHAHAVEEELASLQQRLDEAADRYAAGELPVSMLTRIETTLRPKIEQAQRALVPPISDENIRALVTTGDVRAAWAELALAEQRKIIKAVFDVRVQRTANRGQNAFEPDRVLIAPRVR